VFLLVYRLQIGFGLEKKLADLEVTVGRRTMQWSGTLAEFRQLKHSKKMKTYAKHFQGRSLTRFLNVYQHSTQEENDIHGCDHSCKSNAEECQDHCIHGITIYILRKKKSIQHPFSKTCNECFERITSFLTLNRLWTRRETGRLGHNRTKKSDEAEYHHRCTPDIKVL
jgi:hypothetical protein